MPRDNKNKPYIIIKPKGKEPEGLHYKYYDAREAMRVFKTRDPSKEIMCVVDPLAEPLSLEGSAMGYFKPIIRFYE